MNVLRNILISLLCWGMSSASYAQCLSKTDMADSLRHIELNKSLSVKEKGAGVQALILQFERCNYPADSLYARMLHRLGALYFIGNGYVADSEALHYTLQAVKVNTTTPAANPAFLVNSYYNLGLFYNSLEMPAKALIYFDSSIVIGTRYADSGYALKSGYQKAMLYTQNGEYQLAVNECKRSLELAVGENTINTRMQLLNTMAQADLYLGNNAAALNALTEAKKIAEAVHDSFEKASALKTEARIASEMKDNEKANRLFAETIKVRQQGEGNFFQVADDYIDWGIFEFSRGRFDKSSQYMKEAVKFAALKNSKEQLAKAYLNLASLAIDGNQNLDSAAWYLTKSLTYIGVSAEHQQLDMKAVMPVNNKDLLVSLLETKTGLLLATYHKEKKSAILGECLQTVLLTDSVLTQLRYQHTEEKSKLYWRNISRTIFSNGLEACYLSGNTELAFYFMEKSRAMLLYDKVNEIRATALLPADELKKEQGYKYRIIAAQQRLEDTPGNSQEQVHLQGLKDSLTRYIKSIEKKYPDYYHTKYETQPVSPSVFRRYLAEKGLSFVHYFFHDDVAYILVSAGNQSTILKQKVLPNDITAYIHFCADKQKLNTEYQNWITLSKRLYKQLFEPLKINSGRVAICMDNYLLPFEALVGKDGFLVENFSFSYAYSAASMMQEHHFKNKPKGIFAGFSPISFTAGLSLPDLKESGNWLAKARSFYKNSITFTNKDATRKNFIENLESYSIVNVFSHATADTTLGEPMLFMQDSAVGLRDLQLINQAAAQLILLSACQTNVGKNESGEGIYSLARGFSSAGIPAVSSTLWKADEESVYKISQKFHQYLAAGLPKDEALAKAKLDFLYTGRKEKLPYYWANIVLIGNNEPINFPYYQTAGLTESLLLAALLLIAAFIIVAIVRTISKK